MNTPIIDPSTLTEEQREIIKDKYKITKDFDILLNGFFAEDIAIFEWLFGKDFFKNAE